MLRRYAGERGKERPPGVAAEVPISSGDEVIGHVLALGEADALTEDALEFLHLAAVASLTEVAVEEAKEEVEQNLRGSFLEELRAKPDELDAARGRAPRGAAGLRPRPRRGRALRRALDRPAAPRRGHDLGRVPGRARAAHGAAGQRPARVRAAARLGR